MTRVSPLSPDAITDPELRQLITECEALGVPDATFARILARAQAQAKPLLRAMLASHRDGNVDHKLKEIVRIQLARFAGDRYFAGLRSTKARAAGLTEAEIDAGSGDYEDFAGFTPAEICALRYADQMFLDASKVDAAFYADLKTHYSEAQIMEIGAFIAFHYGMQLFMRSLADRSSANRQ